MPVRLTLAALLLGAGRLTAQDAGLLLGYHQGGAYRTLWITVSGDTAQAVTEVPNLVVPSGSSFWRVGVTTLCSADGTRQVVWQAPLGRVPELPGTACPTDGPGQPSPRGEDSTERQDSTRTDGCDDSTASIYWVSPGWISEGTTFSQTEACEPRGGRWRDSTVLRRFAGHDPVSLGDVYGARFAEVWSAAVAREHRAVSKEMSCPEPAEDDFDPMNWSVQHRRGRLRAVVLANAEYGQCQLWAEVASPLPASITGREAPRLAVDTSKVRDWLVSPRGSYAVTLAEPATGAMVLEVWTVKGGRAGRRLLARPMGSPTRIVEAEWATGRFVREWTTVIRNVGP